jgi:hypothetical protein
LQKENSTPFILSFEVAVDGASCYKIYILKRDGRRVALSGGKGTNIQTIYKIRNEINQKFP